MLENIRTAVALAWNSYCGGAYLQPSPTVRVGGNQEPPNPTQNQSNSTPTIYISVSFRHWSVCPKMIWLVAILGDPVVERNSHEKSGTRGRKQTPVFHGFSRVKIRPGGRTTPFLSSRRSSRVRGVLQGSGQEVVGYHDVRSGHPDQTRSARSDLVRERP